VTSRRRRRCRRSWTRRAPWSCGASARRGCW
jgi:hypothetical protein